MPSISLYEKLLSQLGEKGLLQAAKAEGVAAKSAAEVPESVLDKMYQKLKGGMDRPETAERLPTKSELDAIEKSNKGSDVPKEFRETPADYAPDATAQAPAPGLDTGATSADAESMGLKKMLTGMGAATAAGTAGYMAMNHGASGSWDDKAGPVKDAGLKGGMVPGSLKEAVKAATAPEAPKQAPMPGVPIPKVGARPDDFSAGNFNYDDADYQRKLSDLQSKEEGAKDTYKKKQDINEWGDLAQSISNAVAQYGAARQGLKSGVDLSGLKFEKSDWAGKRDAEGKDLEREQRSLEGQRGLASDSFKAKSGAAERQFGREQEAKDKSTQQKFREYEEQVKARGHAQEEAARLKIEQAKEDRKRTEGLEDFESRQKIEAKYRPTTEKESPAEKENAKRQEALAGLHAAYVSGDDKEIAKQRLAATKYLTPQQSNDIEEASSAWFGGGKKAAKALEAIITGGPGGGSGVSSKGGSVTFEVNGKKGVIPADQADAFQKKYPNAKRVGG